MIALVLHTGNEPLTLDEVKQHCRIDDDAENDAYITNTIIPGARALAEAKTGAIIRKGTFTDTILIGQALSVGSVISVDSVKVDDVDVAFTTTEKGRRTVVQSDGNEGKEAVVGFTAGIDIAEFPDVKSWLLMACGWMYESRELAMPESYVDALLVAIEVPNPF